MNVKCLKCGSKFYIDEEPNKDNLISYQCETCKIWACFCSIQNKVVYMEAGFNTHNPNISYHLDWDIKTNTSLIKVFNYTKTQTGHRCLNIVRFKLKQLPFDITFERIEKLLLLQ